MSEIKVNSIKGVGASAAAITVNNTDGTCTANITNRSNRNLIINGAMQVAQRGTSVAWAANGYLTCDRWHHTINDSAGRFTSKQTADSPDGLGGKCLELDVTTADTSIASNEHAVLAYRFEGQDVQQLAKGTAGAKKFTVSFYVKGNGNATYMCEFFDRTNTRLIHQQFSVTSSWSRVTLTFNNETSGGTITNDNSHEFDMQLWLHAGSNFTGGSYTANTWAGQTNANRAVGISSLFSSTNNFLKITGVQLEVGSVATDFEHRSFQEDLIKCQRYCQKLGGADDQYGCMGVGAGIYNTQAYVPYRLVPVMRSAPSFTLIGSASNFTYIRDGGFYNPSSLGLDAASKTHMNIVATVSTGISHDEAIRLWNNSVDGGFLFTAEL